MEIQDLVYSGNEITETIEHAQGTQTRSIIANGLEVELTAEPYNGNAVIHYEGVIRNSYKDGRTKVIDSGHMYIDTNISSMGVIGRGTGPTSFLAVRGVAQYGEDSKAPVNDFLTKKKICAYKGYECGLVVSRGAGVNSIQIYVHPHNRINWTELDSWTTTRTPASAATIFVDLPVVKISTGDLRYATNGVVSDKILKIEACKTPAHPFYVRWVNNMGGYDYHMFACNHKNSKSLDTNDLAERYGANGAMISYNREGTNKVEVSTGIVDKGTMIAIAEMIYSPDIRWYNEKLGQWIPIHPEPAELAWLEEQPTGEFTLTFKLPNQQINK